MYFEKCKLKVEFHKIIINNDFLFFRLKLQKFKIKTWNWKIFRNLHKKKNLKKKSMRQIQSIFMAFGDVFSVAR